MVREAGVDQVSALSSSGKVWCICLGIQALSNVDAAREEGVWGAKEQEALDGIGKGDLVLYVVGLTSRGGPEARGFPRQDSEKFRQAVDKAKQIILAQATTKIYKDESPVWQDDVYGWRFRFDEIGSARDVSISDVFSPEQIEVLRQCAIQGGTARLLPGGLEGLIGVPHPSLEMRDPPPRPDPAEPTQLDTQDLSVEHRVKRLDDYIGAQGFVFQPWQIATYVAALWTKPFVILAGVSGTGKSKLPQLISEATGAVCKLIPVQPNWTDSSDVLGYEDLQGRFRPGPLLRLAQQAEENPKIHHVCIVDEMNIARVEYYFAEVLSRMEDRIAGDGGGYTSRPLLNLDLEDNDQVWAQQGLPPNLAIVGTVNMDETTHSFSRKVLDRAFTLEFSDIDLTVWNAEEAPESAEPVRWAAESWFPRYTRISEMNDQPDEERDVVKQVVETLEQLNRYLVQAQLQVGYRTRDEAALFVLHARELEPSFITRDGEPVDPLDLVLHMKVLPRIVGGSNAIRRLLLQLLGWAVGGTPFENEDDGNALVARWSEEDRPGMLSGAVFPQTAARLCLMWDRLSSEGFTSFWL